MCYIYRRKGEAYGAQLERRQNEPEGERHRDKDAQRSDYATDLAHRRKVREAWLEIQRAASLLFADIKAQPRRFSDVGCDP